MIEPLRVSVDVACDVEHAIATWTARLLPHFTEACLDRARSKEITL